MSHALSHAEDVGHCPSLQPGRQRVKVGTGPANYRLEASTIRAFVPPRQPASVDGFDSLLPPVA